MKKRECFTNYIYIKKKNLSSYCISSTTNKDLVNFGYSFLQIYKIFAVSNYGQKCRNVQPKNFEPKKFRALQG